jgi:hypothetical protein
MDARIDPAAAFGINLGDAHVSLKNPRILIVQKEEDDYV